MIKCIIISITRRLHWVSFFMFFVFNPQGPDFLTFELLKHTHVDAPRVFINVCKTQTSKRTNSTCMFLL